MIFSRYQRVYSKVERNRGWTSENICRRQALNLVQEMGSKKNNMVESTIAKDQIPDIRWTYTKGTIYFKRSFHDKIYIVSMGMNTKFKVDSHFSNA